MKTLDLNEMEVIEGGARPFIGTVEEKGPCNELLHLQNVTTTTYVFWINVGSHTELKPC